MNPAEKGWLKEYLNFRNKIEIIPEKSFIEKINTIERTDDEFLYALLQPTGLMYGHPVKFPTTEHPQSKEWSEKDKMKVLLAESFISSGIIYQKQKIHNEKDVKETYQDLIKKVADYYLEIFPQLAKKSKSTIFGTKRREINFTESIISRRIDIKQKWDKNFWTSFFENSLLFLDIYYFNQWVNPNKIISISEIHELHDKIRLTVLQIIASAANANHIIEIEERNLYEYFLKSADLPIEKEIEAAKYIDQGFSIDDINFFKTESWLLKKYFLELAILTIWSDQEVHDDEREFIDKLSKKLGFSEEETESSMLAIESFVIQNFEQVHYLQERQNYKIVKDRFVKSMQKMLKFYKNSVVTEMKESKELVFLLNKSVKNELTEEEKEKVRTQLIDILKSLPLFAFIALPGRTLTLPILFKVLPKNVLPSAFQGQTSSSD